MKELNQDQYDYIHKLYIDKKNEIINSLHQISNLINSEIAYIIIKKNLTKVSQEIFKIFDLQQEPHNSLEDFIFENRYYRLLEIEKDYIYMAEKEIQNFIIDDPKLD